MKTMNIVHTEKYTKNGEEKKAYKNVGTLFIYDDGGMSIKLDMVPVNFNGNLSVYEKQDRQPQHGQQQPQQQYGQPQQQAPQGQYNAPQIVQQNIPQNQQEIPF